MTVPFQLAGRDFLGLNGGPMFKFTPAISLFVSCNSEAQIDELFKNLSAGGTVLMPFAKYPFSEKYAWINDRFGLSWQLSLGGEEHSITPTMMFTKEQHGKAEEAIKFYTSSFANSKITKVFKFEEGEPGTAGTIKQALFSLDGLEFRAMDSLGHDFGFTPAISFVVNCKTQADLDDMWSKLSDGGMIVECGWLSDKFGVSWQVVPTALREMLQNRDTQTSDKVMKELLQMKKLDIATLQRAYEG